MIHKKAYICSPLSAETPGEIQENMWMAKRYAKEVSQLLNCRAAAPHSVLPELLDDNDPAERKLALDFGVKYLATCDMLVICGERISSGMTIEIEAASALGIPIFIYVKGRLYAVMPNDTGKGYLHGIRVHTNEDSPAFALQLLFYMMMNNLPGVSEGIDSSGL